MSVRERMKDGRVYFYNDEEIMKEQEQCMEILYDFNNTRPSQMKEMKF